MGGDGKSFGTPIVRYVHPSGYTVIGPICQDWWDMEEANIVCKMLGFQ